MPALKKCLPPPRFQPPPLPRYHKTGLASTPSKDYQILLGGIYCQQMFSAWLQSKHVQPQHAAASNFLSSCVCLPAPALLAQVTFCLPHVSPVCFYLSCHESVICTNNIQSTVNTKHTTFPIRWENSAGEWERQPGTQARKAALQLPPICVEAPPQPKPTIIVNVPRPEPAEPECSQKRRFPYVE